VRPQGGNQKELIPAKEGGRETLKSEGIRVSPEKAVSKSEMGLSENIDTAHKLEVRFGTRKAKGNGFTRKKPNHFSPVPQQGVKEIVCFTPFIEGVRLYTPRMERVGKAKAAEPGRDTPYKGIGKGGKAWINVGGVEAGK